MAIIGSAFDETKALKDQAYAYNAWLNRNYEGNTRGITYEQNKLIETTWSAYMCNWKVPETSQDYTEYDCDIEDADFKLSEEDFVDTRSCSAEDAADETGYDSDLSSEKINSAATNISSVGSAVVGGASVATAVASAGAVSAATSASAAAASASTAASVAVANSVSSIGSDIAGLANGVAVGTSNTATVANATAASAQATAQSAQTAQTVCFVVGCTMALAIGTLYEATKPNKDATQALNELKDLMLASNDRLQVEQYELNNLGDKVVDESTKLEEDKQAKQEELEKKAAVLLSAQLIQQDLVARMNAGEEITPEEKAKFVQAQEQIVTLTTEVQTLANELILKVH